MFVIIVAAAITFVNPWSSAPEGNDEVFCCGTRMPDAIFDAFSVSEVRRVGEDGDGNIGLDVGCEA